MMKETVLRGRNFTPQGTYDILLAISIEHRQGKEKSLSWVNFHTTIF